MNGHREDCALVPCIQYTSRSAPCKNDPSAATQLSQRDPNRASVSDFTGTRENIRICRKLQRNKEMKAFAEKDLTSGLDILYNVAIVPSLGEAGPVLVQHWRSPPPRVGFFSSGLWFGSMNLSSRSRSLGCFTGGESCCRDSSSF